VIRGANSVAEVSDRMQEQLNRAGMGAKTNAGGNDSNTSPELALRQRKIRYARSMLPGEGDIAHHLDSIGTDSERLKMAGIVDEVMENEEGLLTFADFLAATNAPGSEFMQEPAAEESKRHSSLFDVVSQEQVDAVRQYSEQLRDWNRRKAAARKSSAISISGQAVASWNEPPP